MRKLRLREMPCLRNDFQSTIPLIPPCWDLETHPAVGLVRPLNASEKEARPTERSLCHQENSCVESMRKLCGKRELCMVCDKLSSPAVWSVSWCSCWLLTLSSFPGCWLSSRQRRLLKSCELDCDIAIFTVLSSHNPGHAHKKMGKSCG